MASWYTRDGKPTGEPGSPEWKALSDWARCKRVAITKVEGAEVSTVFLALDHGWADAPEPPLIFETMVFPDDEQREGRVVARYATEEEAVRGHLRVVDAMRDGADVTSLVVLA